MQFKSLVAGTVFFAGITPAAIAHDEGPQKSHAMGHAPIGVMADHRHKTGEWMVSYRYMYMDMSGSRDGTDALSADDIATSVPNRFFGDPMQPPTLRVVPTEMPMQMHMIGGMYGLTDRITLMAMGSYIAKEMDHVTYAGGMGTAVLGDFTTEVEGVGDTRLGAIIGLDDSSVAEQQLNISAVISLPTGSITETDDILTPMGMRPTVRLPYPMQLGSGTFDLKLGLTGTQRFQNDWGIGGQVSTIIRLDENDEDYSLGDVLEATVWAAYEPAPWISFSGRVKAKSVGQIDGIDPIIVAPVQTADPDNQGGDTIEALLGVNLLGQSGAAKGHRLAAEIGLPLYRDLNGPQLETDLTVTLGWQKAF